MVDPRIYNMLGIYSDHGLYDQRCGYCRWDWVYGTLFLRVLGGITSQFTTVDSSSLYFVSELSILDKDVFSFCFILFLFFFWFWYYGGKRA